MKVEMGLQSLDVDQYAGDGQRATTIAEMASIARKLEDIGFDGAMSAEAGHDPFLPLMVAAEHTTRIGLGTNVAIAFPRSPMVTAQLAWDLQQLSGGRFQLGLGTQVKGHVERRYATPWTAAPGPRLREYIQCLQAMFKSFQEGRQPTYFEGEHYRFTLMPPFFNPGPIEHPHVPIYVGALNRYMARVAGELCDGLRLHPVATFAYTREVILPAIADGAKRTGRNVKDVEIVGAPFLAVGHDEAAVAVEKESLKQRFAFYASTRTYHSVLEFHGWMDVGSELHRLSREGKWQEMPKLITDEMLDELAIICTADDFAAELNRRCGDLFPTVLLDLPAAMRRDEDWLRATVQAVHGM